MIFELKNSRTQSEAGRICDMNNLQYYYWFCACAILLNVYLEKFAKLELTIGDDMIGKVVSLVFIDGESVCVNDVNVVGLYDVLLPSLNNNKLKLIKQLLNNIWSWKTTASFSTIQFTNRLTHQYTMQHTKKAIVNIVICLAITVDNCLVSLSSYSRSVGQSAIQLSLLMTAWRGVRVNYL